MFHDPGHVASCLDALTYIYAPSQDLSLQLPASSSFFKMYRKWEPLQVPAGWSKLWPSEWPAGMSTSWCLMNDWVGEDPYHSLWGQFVQEMMIQVWHLELASPRSSPWQSGPWTNWLVWAPGQVKLLHGFTQTPQVLPNLWLVTYVFLFYIHFNLDSYLWGWYSFVEMSIFITRGCSSVVEHMLRMYEAPGSIPGISMWFCLGFPGGSDGRRPGSPNLYFLFPNPFSLPIPADLRLHISRLQSGIGTMWNTRGLSRWLYCSVIFQAVNYAQYAWSIRKMALPSYFNQLPPYCSSLFNPI